MAIKHYAELDTHYLPTDGSVPVALTSDAITLTVASGVVSQAVSLEGYDKIAFVTEGDTNTSIDFLEILGNETADATLEIVKDINASSGYALKMTGTQKLVFGTRISYVPDILKKITLKAKKDAGNTGNLYASVVGYANGQYINKLGNISVEDYVSVVDTSSLTDSYTTNIGYIKGVGTSFVEPASNPNSPSELPSTTDEIALILECTGASDIYYIDVISLEEVENTIRDIPDGQGVYDSSQNFNTRNDRIITTPANPVVTTPTTYVLNGDGSIDITFTWTYTGTGDAYNIDGFSIYTHSSDTSTPPTFSDSAVYVDANTRKFTLYGITINKYYTIGVQAYRQIDHDIAVDLALSEDVIRSAIVQTTPYRPVNITPSTTSYAIQRNVGSYLGSESLGSIYIHGYYPNGMRGDIAGQILYNEGSSATDMYLAINPQPVDCTDFTYTADEEYKCYLVLNAGVVKPAVYNINTNTFVNDTETVSTGVVIGYVIVEYTHSGTVYTVKDAFIYENAKLLSMSKTTKLQEAWKYLSEATDQTDWEARVDDLGIESSFTFLAAYNAFVTNLNAENVTAGVGDGTASSGFRFRAMSRENLGLPYNATTNPSVFDIMYNDRKVLEVYPESGDFMLGNYSASTKSGGIYYDYSEDKLLGNVAYDQWDLVIESDADLALLTTGTTTYKNVLVAPKSTSYTLNAPLDLDAHSVERFVGLNKTQCVINVNFDVFTNGNIAVKCGSELQELSHLGFTTDGSAQSSTDYYIIYFSSLNNAIVTDIRVSSLNAQTGLGIFRAVGGQRAEVSNSYFFNLSTGIAYFYNVVGCIFDDCFTGVTSSYSISNCYAYSSTQEGKGFSDCTGLVNCVANNKSTGFIWSYNLSNCRSTNGGTSFNGCYYLSSCRSDDNAFGYIDCSYISSSVSTSDLTGWTNNTNIDYDSTNCDQEWILDTWSITTSGYVIPIGEYHIIKSSSQLVYLQIWDGSSWINTGTVTSGGGAYPTVHIESDGVNFRLLPSSSQTITFRRKP